MKNEFKILFVYPNFTLSNALLPAGIPLLSAVLKKNGFDVKLFDTTLYKLNKVTFDEVREGIHQLKKSNLSRRGVTIKNENIYEAFIEEVRSYKPSLIAVSTVEDTFEIAISLLEKLDMKIPTVVGGIYSTLNPEYVINNKHVDIVCRGEGELALLELCNNLYRNKDIRHIENLWVKADDKIYKNSLRELVKLDDLEFADYSIFEKERFYRPMQGNVLRMVPIEMQRGCPFACSYCADHSLNVLYKKQDQKYFRFKSAKRMISEIKYHIEKYDAEYLYFNAETFFAMPKEEFKIFAAEYKNIKLPFWVQTRPELITDYYISTLKDMNCTNINVGIEHGNEEFREKVLNRKVSNKKIIEGLSIIKKHNIQVTVNNMIGFPDETRELVFDTIELNRQIEYTTTNAYIFYPYYGTELYKYSQRKNYLSSEKASFQGAEAYPFFTTKLNLPTISNEELLGLQKTFVLYTTLPKALWPEIKIAERFNKKGNLKYEELCNKYLK